MQSIPNLISFLRAPLALLFLTDNIYLRSFAILAATLSDGLDGYLARKHDWTSRIGTLLDPLMDRFFVLFIIAVFLKEGSLELWQASLLLLRDGAVILFGIYLVIKKRLAKWRFGAIWCGKVTTFLQFIFLFLVTLEQAIPNGFYAFFILFGAMALVELYLSKENEQTA
jgi:phosphatidylglycerophosphate synthase